MKLYLAICSIALVAAIVYALSRYTAPIALDVKLQSSPAPEIYQATSLRPFTLPDVEFTLSNVESMSASGYGLYVTSDATATVDWVFSRWPASQS